MELEQAKELFSKYSKSSEANKKRCFALRNWNERNYSFPLMELFAAIAEKANSKTDDISEIIDIITDKKKGPGRGYILGTGDNKSQYVTKDEKGKPVIFDDILTNNDMRVPGQHPTHSKNVLKKDGSGVKKNVVNSREKLYDLGEKIRSIDAFKGMTNHELTLVMALVKAFAKRTKKSEQMIADGLASGKYKIGRNEKGKLVIGNPKRISITESQMVDLGDALKLTEFKFYNNVQRFLADLLKDPVGAKIPDLLSMNNFNKDNLLWHLKNQGIINKHQRISDKDSQGNPKTATMLIKYSVPKKNFARKMKKLFIAMVKNNVPEKIEKMISEDNECGNTAENSGQFITNAFPTIRRTFAEGKLKEDGEASAAGDAGGIGYTAPVSFGKKDDEVYDRTPGGICCQHADESVYRKVGKLGEGYTHVVNEATGKSNLMRKGGKRLFENDVDMIYGQDGGMLIFEDNGTRMMMPLPKNK